MGRGVHEAVGWQDAVLAGTSHPVVSGMIVPDAVHQLDPALAGEEEPDRRLLPIAAMVMPGGLKLDGNRVRFFDLAGVQIAAFVEVTIRRGRDGITDRISLPDETVDDEDVQRCVKPAAGRAFPQFLTVIGGQGRQVARQLAEDHVVGNDQRVRAEADALSSCFSLALRFTFRLALRFLRCLLPALSVCPSFFTRFQIETGHAFVDLDVDLLAVRGERLRPGIHFRVRPRPECLAGLDVDREDRLLVRLFVRLPKRGVPECMFDHRRALQNQQDVAGENDLLGTGRVFERFQCFAGDGVHDRDGRPQPQRRVEAFSGGDQQSGHLWRPGSEPELMPGPRLHRLLPQHHAAESVAGNDDPFAGHVKVCGSGLIQDVKQPACRCDD